MKFKIGDKVKCIKQTAYLMNGEIYTVTHISKGLYNNSYPSLCEIDGIAVDNEGDAFMDNRFVLAKIKKKENPTYKSLLSKLKLEGVRK